MGLLIATKHLPTMTMHDQLHGDAYEVDVPHTLVKYKLNNEKTKFLEMKRVAKDNEDVLLQLMNRSKRLISGTFSFAEWDAFYFFCLYAVMR